MVDYDWKTGPFNDEGFAPEIRLLPSVLQITSHLQWMAGHEPGSIISPHTKPRRWRSGYNWLEACKKSSKTTLSMRPYYRERRRVRAGYRGSMVSGSLLGQAWMRTICIMRWVDCERGVWRWWLFMYMWSYIYTFFSLALINRFFCMYILLCFCMS